MLHFSLVAFTASAFLAVASPLDKRQYPITCSPSAPCLTYTGTKVFFAAQTDGSCPSVTAPPAVDLPAVTPTDQPELCFYPTLNYCQMGSSAAMTAMSSLATALYNAQSSGAVLCGATKTANLAIIPPASPVEVTPVSEITVEAQPGR
ncbi:uncharacterized protein PV09_08249 [Verruconis gallopava]|uniref:Uncharacterized protein n=1 Tax=Verruconis gallopava TaxID=253628 RepID=A0A0D2AM33_9PEZI|nr:uncharacterized protein PV09_08249 [Verruconis gallopava]KIW00209.1 hypothetical protein PV09_08249 [Verruconis gallopava]